MIQNKSALDFTFPGQEMVESSSVNLNQVIDEGVNHTISSQYLGKDFFIKVKLPWNYNENRTEGYPLYFFWDSVFYASSSQPGDVYTSYLFNEHWYNWTLFTEITGGPESIMVTAIAKNHGYSSYYSDMVNNMNSTYYFLIDELIPLMDQEYNVDDQELILSGSGLGGSFVLSVFYDYLDAPFKYYVSIYPELISRTEQFTIKEEDMYRNSQQQDLPHRVLFLSSNAEQFEVFRFLLNLTINMFRRGYINQAIMPSFAPVPSFVPYVIEDSLYRIFQTEPSVSFLSNVEFEAFNGLRSDPRHYVNETIEFIFTGHMGNRTQANFEWLINGEFVNNTVAHSQSFIVTGVRDMELRITDEFTVTYSVTRSFFITPLPVPPFDFRTARTTLNTDEYPTKSITEDLPLPYFWIIPLLIPIIRHKRQFLRK